MVLTLPVIVFIAVIDFAEGIDLKLMFFIQLTVFFLFWALLHRIFTVISKAKGK